MSEELRRSERISLKLPLTMVHHNEAGRTVYVSTMTTAVSCHGAAISAVRPCPVGTQVYLLDTGSNRAFWGRVVWQDKAPTNGVFPTGVEFSVPQFHWFRQLDPGRERTAPASTQAQPRVERPLGKAGVRVRMRLSGRSTKVLRTLFGKTERRDRQCQCCGGKKQLVYIPDEKEIVCRLCRHFEVAA